MHWLHWALTLCCRIVADYLGVSALPPLVCPLVNGLDNKLFDSFAASESMTVIV